MFFELEYFVVIWLYGVFGKVYYLIKICKVSVFIYADGYTCKIGDRGT